MKLQDKYIIIEEIGSGSFGEVYKGRTINNSVDIAIKVENIQKTKRIEHEYKVYKLMTKRGVKHIIPKLIDFIVTPKYCFLCLQMLGKSLDDIFNEHSHSFNIETVLSLAVTFIYIIKHVHQSGFIHRDIKPSNFLIGYNDPQNIYIMDFGLAKKYIDSQNNHIKFREGRSMIGTVRYCSINMHLGLEPSRRDDLESIGYMLVFFAKGKLPWQGLKKRKNQNHFDNIGEVKMCTNLNVLCDGLPDCFKEYIMYCRNLSFNQEPDYDYLIDMFYQTKEDYSSFEWIKDSDTIVNEKINN